MEPFCYLCFVYVMLPCLFNAAMWSPAGEGLGSLVCEVSSCVCHFPIWCHGSGVVLIVSILYVCLLPYF